jgi:hypothetical protein
MLLAVLLVSSILAVHGLFFDASPPAAQLVARQQAVPTCINNASNNTIHTTQGKQFRLYCNLEYDGGNSDIVGGVTFQACIDNCAGKTTCKGNT